MAKKSKYKVAGMVCQDCGSRGYVSTRNTQHHQEPLEHKKYCKQERKHTVHKETKKNLGRNEV